MGDTFLHKVRVPGRETIVAHSENEQSVKPVLPALRLFPFVTPEIPLKAVISTRFFD